MQDQQASKIAMEVMKSGKNCCQSVLLAAGKVWNIPIGDDILAAANQFGEGMGSGCTCGALAGMVMAVGIRQQYDEHPRGSKLVKELHDQFKHEFGATCCRAIKKKRSVLDRIGNRACVELTGKTAALLVKQWERIDNGAESPGIDYNTHSE